MMNSCSRGLGGCRQEPLVTALARAANLQVLNLAATTFPEDIFQQIIIHNKYESSVTTDRMQIHEYISIFP